VRVRVRVRVHVRSHAHSRAHIVCGSCCKCMMSLSCSARVQPKLLQLEITATKKQEQPKYQPFPPDIAFQEINMVCVSIISVHICTASRC
jgi:hypothetical protein